LANQSRNRYLTMGNNSRVLVCFVLFAIIEAWLSNLVSMIVLLSIFYIIQISEMSKFLIFFCKAKEFSNQTQSTLVRSSFAFLSHKPYVEKDLEELHCSSLNALLNYCWQHTLGGEEAKTSTAKPLLTQFVTLDGN